MILKRSLMAAIFGLTVHTAKAQENTGAILPSVVFTGISYHRVGDGICQPMANMLGPDGREERSNLVSIDRAIAGLRHFPLRPGQTPDSRSATVRELEKARRELARKSAMYFNCDAPATPVING